MNIYELMFIIQFVAVVGILLAKLYNVFSFGEWYDMRMAWLLFISWILAYGVGFVLMLMNVEILVYSRLFMLESWLLWLNVLLIIAETFLMWKSKIKTPVSSFKSIVR